MPPLAPPRGHVAPVPRVINLGLNPLHCPLPPWAHAVSASCRWLVIASLSPTSGPRAGGTALTLRVDERAWLDGLTCHFSASEAEGVLVPARAVAAGELTCDAPAVAAPAAYTVRLAHDGRAVSQFGAPFEYTD